MTIVTAPHPALRQTAKSITDVDKKLHDFVTNIGQTLKTNKRRGVGLAAPQVEKQWRLFVTNLTTDGDRDEAERQLKVYINPRIVAHSHQKEIGGTPDDTPLEGCLSIPSIYGPVPRYFWVEVEFEKISGDKLISAKEKLEDFPARLAQHEIDHLDGVLFTDYTLRYDLPLYQDNPDTEKLEKFSDRSMIEMF
jgi:peptide deformylase